MSVSTLIELQNISKNYQLGHTSIEALNDINLVINKHEFIALWGPSGSGKTTLCNIISLLDQPDYGALYLNNQAISYFSDQLLSQQRSKDIGIIFQNFNLLPVLTVLENVMLPLQIKGLDYQLARKLAKQQLLELDLADYIDQYPAKISGGQQQRVAIARALVSKPSLIIADEPTANLDSDTAHEIIDLMMEINNQDGTTFVFSTHDQRLLERVKRQILLTDGKVCEDKHVQ